MPHTESEFLTDCPCVERGNVLSFDISDGKEAIRIPLINDSGIDVPMPAFRYIRHFDHISDAARRLIDEAAAVHQTTGCQRRDTAYYSEEGLLTRTQPEGIKECPRTCTHRNNAVARTGIRYPLEVFRTEEKGWGVRCSVDISSGAFVCEYMGEILTDEEAVRCPMTVLSSGHMYRNREWRCWIPRICFLWIISTR